MNVYIYNTYTPTHTHSIYIYIHNYFTYVCISSSCHAASTDRSDPLSPPVPIAHWSWEVFQAISCIDTELLYIDSSWSSYL